MAMPFPPQVPSSCSQDKCWIFSRQRCNYYIDYRRFAFICAAQYCSTPNFKHPQFRPRISRVHGGSAHDNFLAVQHVAIKRSASGWYCCCRKLTLGASEVRLRCTA